MNPRPSHSGCRLRTARAHLNMLHIDARISRTAELESRVQLWPGARSVAKSESNLALQRRPSGSKPASKWSALASATTEDAASGSSSNSKAPDISPARMALRGAVKQAPTP